MKDVCFLYIYQINRYTQYIDSTLVYTIDIWNAFDSSPVLIIDK